MGAEGIFKWWAQLCELNFDQLYPLVRPEVAKVGLRQKFQNPFAAGNERLTTLMVPGVSFTFTFIIEAKPVITSSFSLWTSLSFIVKRHDL